MFVDHFCIMFLSWYPKLGVAYTTLCGIYTHAILGCFVFFQPWNLDLSTPSGCDVMPSYLVVKGVFTPHKINMKPTNHPFGKEHDRNQTSMIMFHVSLFSGVFFYLPKKKILRYASMPRYFYRYFCRHLEWRHAVEKKKKHTTRQGHLDTPGPHPAFNTNRNCKP